MLVLGLSGSLRSGSFNSALLRAAAGVLPAATRFETFDALADVPPFSEDHEASPPVVVVDLRRAIDSADALLIATPEYNASVPGQLKNAIDWASRPYPASALRDKPVAVIGTSTGPFGAVWAHAELRRTLGAAGAQVVDEELSIGGADDAFDARLNLVAPGARAGLVRVVRRLTDASQLVHDIA